VESSIELQNEILGCGGFTYRRAGILAMWPGLAWHAGMSRRSSGRDI